MKLRIMAVFAVITYIHVLAASAATIYVDAGSTAISPDGQSWSSAYPSLQTALSQAQAADVIWVAEGTYRPSDTAERTVSFSIPAGVSLYGGFGGQETTLEERDVAVHPAILSGDYAGNDSEVLSETNSRSDNAQHVIRCLEAGSEVHLDGFTIQGGNANAASPNDRGAGVYVLTGETVLVNCVLRGHVATSTGAAASCISGILAFRNCRIEHNLAGTGGGLFGLSSTLSMAQCVVRDNAGGLGGAIYLGSSAPLTAENCIFSENSAAAEGGALYVSYSSSAGLLNCTIAYNTASSAGGAIALQQGTASLENCIVWGNTAPMFQDYAGNSVTASYCVLQEPFSGAGNQTADPRFRLVPDPFPYSLTWDSPAVDAASGNAPATDLAGALRPMNAADDIGALEFETDTDGGGLPDGYETVIAFDLNDDADDKLDSDGDGLDNLDEFRRGSNPLDSNDPQRSFYVDRLNGVDETGTGAEDAPWKTIAYAFSRIPEATAAWPVTVYLSAGTFNERVVLPPHTRLVGESADTTSILYGTGEITTFYTITAGEDTELRDLTVGFSEYMLFAAGLLRVDNVNARISNVRFNGLHNPASSGVFVTGEGSSQSDIRYCQFLDLQYGVYAIDTAVNITRNVFDDILGGATYVRPPSKAKLDAPMATPLLGKADNSANSGFNRFRNIRGFFVDTATADPIKAEFNDWGVYNAEEIRAKLVVATGKTGSGGEVDFEPFIGKSMSILAATIVMEIRGGDTSAILPASLAPWATAGSFGLERDGESGLFLSAGLSGGTYRCAGGAQQYLGASQDILLKDGEISAVQFLLARDPNVEEGEGEDVTIQEGEDSEGEGEGEGESGTDKPKFLGCGFDGRQPENAAWTDALAVLGMIMALGKLSWRARQERKHLA